MSRLVESWFTPSADGATRGDLRTLTLAELAQIISLGGKTARVTLRAQGESGAIWFESGVAIHAECGRGLSGTPAFYRMLAWKEGEFVIEYDVTTEKRSLEGDVMYHVFEGLRRVDEAVESPSAPSLVSTPAPKEPIRGRLTRSAIAAVPALAVLAGGLAWWSMASAPRPADPPPPPDAALTTAASSEPAAPATRAHAKRSPSRKPRPPASSRESGKKAPRAKAEPASAPADIAPADLLASPPGALDYTPAPAPDPFDVRSPAPAEAAPALQEAWLGLVVRSKLESGVLSIVIDGETAYSAPLERTGHSKPRASEQSEGSESDRFDARLPLRAGTHRLAARIRLEDGSEAQTAESTFALEPGATREVSIIAGAKRTRPIAIELD